jgi:uncharacterized protein YyaL (SSP411 family)
MATGTVRAAIVVLAIGFIPALGDGVVAASAVPPRSVSPYLTLHADDAVQWLPWNEATLELARRSGKLILLSSGYYACHYCHVMKRESFENAKIAAFINRHFIPVLVDRELNPVLDAQLLQFMQEIGAPQGWPLNVIMTPGAYPLMGTVYRPPGPFLEFLQKIQEQWRTDPGRWERAAQAAADGIVARARLALVAIEPAQYRHYGEVLQRQALLVADEEHGGFGDGAKYPMSPQLMALLQLQQTRPDARLGRHLHHTLRQMAGRGLRDPLDGGFFRYTTDRTWGTPHFEKMLYDNAQLAMVYLDAARILGEPEFETVARKTLDFIVGAFAHSDGALVASLSAEDEHGVDGGYYLWTESELKAMLSAQEFRVATRLWQTVGTGTGNAEPRYLPTASGHADAVARASGLPPQQAQAALQSAQRKVYAARSQRRLPRDDKRLAGWNGLALLAFARAARSAGASAYRDTAGRIHRYIAGTLWNGRRLETVPGGGGATLADHAFVAAGLLAYAQLTGEPGHFRLCRDIVEQAWRRFYIDGFWRSSENLLLPYAVYPVTLPDAELPSPSATLIGVTLALGDHIEPAYTMRARQARRTADTRVIQAPFFHATQIAGLVPTHE